MRFSGKLSPVTTHLEDQIRIEPTPAPEQGEIAVRRAPAAKAAEAPGPAGGQMTGREIGGREGPEPTRFGDWELRGRCIDF
jgi:hypothetical protein